MTPAPCGVSIERFCGILVEHYAEHSHVARAGQALVISTTTQRTTLTHWPGGGWMRGFARNATCVAENGFKGTRGAERAKILHAVVADRDEEKARCRSDGRG